MISDKLFKERQVKQIKVTNLCRLIDSLYFSLSNKHEDMFIAAGKKYTLTEAQKQLNELLSEYSEG